MSPFVYFLLYTLGVSFSWDLNKNFITYEKKKGRVTLRTPKDLNPLCDPRIDPEHHFVNKRLAILCIKFTKNQRFGSIPSLNLKESKIWSLILHFILNRSTIDLTLGVIGLNQINSQKPPKHSSTT